MKTNMLRKFPTTLTQIAALGLALICFTNQTRAAEVGGVYRPSTNADDARVSHGYLVVYTPTRESDWGCGSDYYIHTGYEVYDASGKSVEWVTNHDTTIDEHPQTVKLVPGNYTIRGRGVAARVQIKLAETTRVHLDN
jgi:hypothetical protein